jgi:hypothetical protein
MVDTVASDRSGPSFGEAVLPRLPWANWLVAECAGSDRASFKKVAHRHLWPHHQLEIETKNSRAAQPPRLKLYISISIYIDRRSPRCYGVDRV